MYNTVDVPLNRSMENGWRMRTEVVLKRTGNKSFSVRFEWNNALKEKTISEYCALKTRNWRLKSWKQAMISANNKRSN